MVVTRNVTRLVNITNVVVDADDDGLWEEWRYYIIGGGAAFIICVCGCAICCVTCLSNRSAKKRRREAVNFLDEIKRMVASGEMSQEELAQEAGTGRTRTPREIRRPVYRRQRTVGVRSFFDFGVARCSSSAHTPRCAHVRMSPRNRTHGRS